MSSTQYRVLVISCEGSQVDLELRLVGDHSHVYAEPGFLARVIAESLPEPRVVELLGGAESDASERAWDWLTAHADALIDERSIRVHDEADYPNEHGSESRLVAQYTAEFAASWQSDRDPTLHVIRQRIHELGAQLEFESDPSMYAAATLADLVHELVDAHFEALARRRPRASIAFAVRDSKWVSHLRAGDEFDSLAWPL